MIGLVVSALRLAAAAVAVFAVFHFDAYRSEDRLFEVTDQLVNGARFKTETLERIAKLAADGPLTASGQTGLSMVHHAIVQNAIALNASARTPSGELPKLYEQGRASAQAALSRSPSDSFQWYLLFWYATKPNGFDFKALPWLEASYRFGRNEGWIAQRRLVETVGFYPSLGEELRAALRQEFLRMVGSGMYLDALSAYERANSAAQSELLAEIGKLSERDRAAFALYAQRQQLDLAVPGVPEQKRDWIR